ncbi:MAG: RNB domain-containing ribonuclease [Propionibacteriaceae bacterium]|nr:RNB domain-containing ribonuclease [Propionibacteriaceae bacterium]
MPNRELVVLGDVPPALVDGLTQLAGRLELPSGFSRQVAAEAAREAADGPIDGRVRETIDLPFVTIDPAGSMDLDQALFIEPVGKGYRVWYAIADVAAWVRPGGAIDTAAWQRGETYYAPQTRLPLHPTCLSEGAASLLPDGTPRPANVWRIDLDSSGAVTDFAVTRNLVTSTAKLDYESVQRDLDAGTALPSLQLLKTVGRLRIEQESARGGVSLRLPEQQVTAHPDEHWSLSFRTPLPVEDWNAQISLMTGFCAASLMRSHGVGILRTLPPADVRTIILLRSVARSLGLGWARRTSYADFVRRLDPAKPTGQAMMNSCTVLFRGAGYTVIGSADDSGNMPHAALASEYAHTTAPLRRLVDRFTGTICASLAAGQPVPEWTAQALEQLPATMAESNRRSKAFESGIIALTEALALQDAIGQQFVGVIIEVDDRNRRQGVVSLTAQAVQAKVRASHPLALGAQVNLQLVKADIATGEVAFTQV